jgi:hypothetical protein
MTYTAAPVDAKRPGPPLKLAIIAIVVGTVLGITGLAEAIANVVHNFNGPRATTPAVIHTHLRTGTWQVYVDEHYFGASLSPSDVVVIGPSGQHLTVTPTPSNVTETITTGGRAYLAEERFGVSVAGDYTVEVGGSRGVPILLSRSFGDIAKSSGGWFALMGFGMLIGVIGVILLIVTLVRRHNASRAARMGMMAGAPPVSLPPPGWYADPSNPSLQRWWDGGRWTDQTNPPQG